MVLITNRLNVEANTHIHNHIHTQSVCVVLTLQVEDRLTVGLDPSVHSAVSELVLNCLLLSYSLSYEEQEVRESRPHNTHSHKYNTNTINDATFTQRTNFPKNAPPTEHNHLCQVE